MKNFLLVVLFGFMLSSSYDIQIKMEDYQGIRQGSTTVFYNGETAGKVKKISEDDNGGYLVTLKIYDTFDISEDMIFKVENRKLVVDLDGMEKRRLKKEEQRLARIKAEEEEKLAKIQAAEKEKARQLEAEENARIAAEQEKVRLKAEAEEKALRLKAAADSSPFKGDIEAIKQFQKNNNLQADGFWGASSQKVYDRLEEERMKADQLRVQQEEAQYQEELIEQAKKKEKAKQAALEAKKSNEDYVEEQEKTEIKSDRDLLKQQYDTSPRLKRKLKINSKKYKDNWPVTIKFLINKKGYVEEVSIKESSGNAKFDAAAKKAVKKSKWHPAKKHDIPVAAWHELEISF